MLGSIAKEGHSEGGGGRGHTGCSATIHGVFDSVSVCVLALTRQLLVAEIAVSAGDLEGSDNTVAFLELGDFGAPFEDSATELVAEDVAFL